MIAVDTNVLLRWLTADDPAQTSVVRALIDRVQAEGAGVHVSTIAVCETAWVLRSVYRLSRSQIADGLGQLLHAEAVLVEHADRVERALSAFRSGSADLSDYLIREAAYAAGAAAVVTFDRDAATEEGFVHPDPRNWPEGLSVRESAPRYGRARRPAGVSRGSARPVAPAREP